MAKRLDRKSDDRPSCKSTAPSLEEYGSRADQRTTQNGPLLFSSFLFAAVFAAALGAGYAIVGAFGVWWLAASFALACFAVMSVRIAMQWEKVVIFRFGKFNRTKGPGLYVTIPFIEQIALNADQRIMVTGFGAEETLTSDLVPINVDAVLFWMVWDAERPAWRWRTITTRCLSLRRQPCAMRLVERACPRSPSAATSSIGSFKKSSKSVLRAGASRSCPWRFATS